jgi:4-aminobutyrate aminotransferase/(S)-3-amino-2-methylpropionate transaminase
VIEEERLVERGAELGETIRARMEGWTERFDVVGDVRGLGSMLAIEIVRDVETKEPDADLATAIVEEASARGLLLLKAGLYSNCVRVLVPQVIADGELEEALDAWEEAIAAATGSADSADSRVDEQAAAT